ncbi:glycine zipper 2TM domain-containing protein [Sphingomonas oligophenolica]|uniref:17 kDa surface antigen n=1 Tax=Sphingomonas oligophenolica TaxID=301154 RepID=A0A502CJ34_9SPHN|nr:glycine zipper 2TM domain-containing protein [Sphingomonas oligophenolica]TPG13645.1 glycine zipper 2TM domain-containing protein [Sphingomonas oligophenolica]
MRRLLLGVGAAMTLAGCSALGGYGSSGLGSGYSAYDYNRPDPSYNGYYADRYYTQNSRYGERRMANNDRVYVGQNGQYYCRRPDGTTGLIVGGIAGGALGALITSGGSQTLGTLLGAAGGAIAGRAIDRNNVKCK